MKGYHSERLSGLPILCGDAGHAGGSAAAFLRQFGWQGAITLVGTEPLLPYQRPPLSKAWLKGSQGAPFKNGDIRKNILEILDKYVAD